MRNELSRMGRAVADGATHDGAMNSLETDGYLATLRQKARETFGKKDIDVITRLERPLFEPDISV